MRVLEFELGNEVLRARYDKLFESAPDAFIQQSTWWAEVIKDIGPDRPIFLLCEFDGADVAGLPLYLYQHQLGNVLTSVPQPGPMGGIFLKPGVPVDTVEQIYEGLLQRADELAQRFQCLSLTLITNPFQPDVDLYTRLWKPTYFFENFTQSIPLRTAVKDGKITVREYNRSSYLRRHMRRAQEAGFSVECHTTTERLPAWHEIHVARHTEIGANPIALNIFDKILTCLGPRNKAHLQIVSLGSEIASGCVYIYHRNVLDVYLISGNTKFNREAPNFLNTEQSILWAAQRGFEQYNWQSSPAKNSGVFRFKEEWGSLDLPYYFLTKIFCDSEKIRSIGLDRVRASYPMHYVAPFGIFTESPEKTRFQKC